MRRFDYEKFENFIERMQIEFNEFDLALDELERGLPEARRRLEAVRLEIERLLKEFVEEIHGVR